MTLKEPLEGPVETRSKHKAKASTNWKSFGLHNDQLSKLAKNIEDIGLGNLSDAYLSIIPALSVESKLPEVSLIVDLAAENARYHERQQHWPQAGAVYLWLFRVAMTFPVENELSTLATVRIVDFLRQVGLALYLSREQIQFNARYHYALDFMRIMYSLQRDLENEIRSKFHGPLEVASTVLAILKLYEDQRRPWQCNLVEDSTLVSGNNSGCSKSTYRYHKKLRHTDLHEAVWTEDHNRFMNAIRRGEDVNAKDILGWTPAHYGIYQYSLLDELIITNRKDVNVNARDLVEWTPLHYACQYRKEPHEEVGHGVSSRQKISWSSFYSVIRRLIDEGANIDAQGRDGVAPIHCAAMTGFVEAVKLLTDTGANVNIIDARGKTALHWAAFYGERAAVEYLWETAKRALRDREGRTVLHLAVISGNWKTVIWLVNNDADVMVRDRQWRIPLHQAAWEGSLDVVQLMCQKNPAVVNTSDRHGLTSLCCAVENGQDEVVQWLLEHTTAEVNQIWQGNSLVLSAIRGSHAGVVEVLIKHGVSLTSRSRNGMSLLHESILYGNEEITEMLLKAGVRDSFDDDGNSVIKKAKGDEKERVFRSLLEKYDVNLDEE
ncbi:hypothetical protein HER10_EVM0002829 [Colletotrichum scovillei]|uniref:uncharacterized protein n=1 Tax=Colletotrichum scovillei TaxID=1209932 RepID=UPI0015C3B18E|nr:uncharacterized protein HER10_EVM0002829 [Colletotrichum scovillei]KAF4773645.1 hypothetical protein HER10_EVM0002829 [Colletotrichum scovillei]